MRRRSLPAAGQGVSQAPDVRLEAVTKRFGAKTAVDDVSLSLPAGTFLVLLGASGSGKSTLLRCLAGIDAPTSGTIAFGDTVVDGPGVHVPPDRRGLAMVFQDYALWPHLTAQANVSFALDRTPLPADERRSRAGAMLDKVGLPGLAGRYPGQLSGGEQQRVALARALVGRPGLLLFDEPLSNLDADRREQLRVDIGAMVREQGATAVYITHDQAEAFALADRIGVLREGRLCQLASPEEVYFDPADAFVARFTGLAGELNATVVDAGPAPAMNGAAGLNGATAPANGRGPASSRDTLRVAVAGGELVGRPLGSWRPAAGQPVRVLVRPRALQLGAEGSGIAGTVRDAAFRGWGYEHVIELPGGQALAGVAADHRLPFGRSVTVSVATHGCLVVPDGI